MDVPRRSDASISGRPGVSLYRCADSQVLAATLRPSPLPFNGGSCLGRGQYQAGRSWSIRDRLPPANRQGVP
jgi:hypothetical protein